MPRSPEVARSVAGMRGSLFSKLAHRLGEHQGEIYPLHVGDTWLEPADGCRMQDLSVEEFPGMHRYAAPHGHPLLLDAVTERLRERHGVPTDRDDVLVTAGATGGLGAVVGATVDPGDEVLLAAPHWPLIDGIVRSLLGEPVAAPILGSVTDAAGAVQQLEEHRSDRTVALYVSTPNNPTGRVLPAEWLEAMVEWARRHRLWILSDEVYEDWLYDGEHTYCRSLAPERTFSAHSFSKAFGMAGNRCGYVVGPGSVMTAVRKVSTHTFYSAPTASQIAGARALDGRGDDWIAAARPRYREIGDEAADRLGLERPEGSQFLWLEVAGHLDDRGLLGFLEDCADEGLFLAPGDSFGPYPTHVRACYTAVEPEVTRRGIEILARRLGG